MINFIRPGGDVSFESKKSKTMFAVLENWLRSLRCVFV